MSRSYIFLLKIERSYTFFKRLVYCLSNDFRSGSLVVHARKFDILSITPDVWFISLTYGHRIILFGVSQIKCSGIPNRMFGIRVGLERLAILLRTFGQGQKLKFLSHSKAKLTLYTVWGTIVSRRTSSHRTF
jgi:hypothetical protein